MYIYIYIYIYISVLSTAVGHSLFQLFHHTHKTHHPRNHTRAHTHTHTHTKRANKPTVQHICQPELYQLYGIECYNSPEVNRKPMKQLPVLGHRRPRTRELLSRTLPHSHGDCYSRKQNTQSYDLYWYRPLKTVFISTWITLLNSFVRVTYIQQFILFFQLPFQHPKLPLCVSEVLPEILQKCK